MLAGIIKERRMAGQMLTFFSEEEGVTGRSVGTAIRSVVGVILWWLCGVCQEGVERNSKETAVRSKANTKTISSYNCMWRVKGTTVATWKECRGNCVLRGSPSFCLRTGPQNVVPHPAASSSPGNVREMQILGPYHGLMDLRWEGRSPSTCALTNILGDSEKT